MSTGLEDLYNMQADEFIFDDIDFRDIDDAMMEDIIEGDIIDDEIYESKISENNRRLPSVPDDISDDDLPFYMEDDY